LIPVFYALVYNLVENAIKYNHSDGQVTVNAYKKQKHIYLSVEDTGSGIPKELRERVFEPFFRVDKSRSRELGGVGLGLALVHEIVRVHDGSISILNIKVEGSKCVGCNQCSKACKMDIDVCKTPNHPECIRCGACIKACPKDAIQYQFLGKTCPKKEQQQSTITNR
jgi:NAD-dependent dihydropyrimidine dehydrogenase PreA subunit